MSQNKPKLVKNKKAVYSVVPDMIQALMTNGVRIEFPDGFAAKCTDGIPTDAKIENAFWNAEKQFFSLVVSHPVFNQLPNDVTTLVSKFEPYQSEMISIDELSEAVTHLRMALNTVLESRGGSFKDQEEEAEKPPEELEDLKYALKFVQKWENKFDVIVQDKRKKFAQEQREINLKNGLPVDDMDSDNSNSTLPSEPNENKDS